MPRERERDREVGEEGRRKGKEGRRKTRRKGERTEAFVFLFRVIPRGQINPCCLSPFWLEEEGGERGGDGGGRKRITSTEGEWHKVENLPVVYRLVYNTGLSERPRSPASPLL